MSTNSGNVKLEVNFLTFHDDYLPASDLTDSSNPDAFVLTTGGFPQEMIFGTRAACARLSKVELVLDEAKDITLSGCASDNTTQFTTIAELSVKRGERGDRGRRQIEVIELDPNGNGKDIRALKLTIHSGYDDFVGIFGVHAWGEESQQRLAVIESRPEVSM